MKTDLRKEEKKNDLEKDFLQVDKNSIFRNDKNSQKCNKNRDIKLKAIERS